MISRDSWLVRLCLPVSRKQGGYPIEPLVEFAKQAKNSKQNF